MSKRTKRELLVKNIIILLDISLFVLILQYGFLQVDICVIMR